MTTNRPKIGIALSGSAGRGIAHIGILEVFEENNIPIDIVVGCSSGGLIAVAYGAGTMEWMKQVFHNFSWKWFMNAHSFWSARGGLLTSRKADAEYAKLTAGKGFEQMRAKIGISAADIRTGELVTLTSGNVKESLMATIALPGVFEPVVIEGRLLVDGGLINVIPTVPTRQMGADIVIGIDLARNKFLYQRRMWFWRIIRTIRRMIGIEFVQHQVINPLTSKVVDRLETMGYDRRAKIPNMFRVFAWGVDHSFDVEEELTEEHRACDLMIRPDVQEKTSTWGVTGVEWAYQQGRKAAEESLPKIRELIANFEKNK